MKMSRHVRKKGKGGVGGFRGFTLIELLVVISIISLLSSIVLASLTEAREEARNSAVKSEVNSYFTALELYHQDNGGYPDPGSTYTWYCLGSPACDGAYPSQSSQLEAALEDYIAETKNPNSRIMAESSFPYVTSYTCTVIDDGVCEAFYVYWWLEGEDRDCGPQHDLRSNYGGDTYCRRTVD